MKEILIALPIKNRADILPLPLYSLFQQTLQNFDVLLYDQSDEPCTENYIVRQQIDLLQVHKDIKVTHIRRMKDRSLAQARVWLLKYARDEGYKRLLMLDDDVLMQPDCLEKLNKEIKRSDVIFTEAIAMDVNNALKHSDYSIDVKKSPEGISPWAVNHYYYDSKHLVERYATTGGFHYLIDMEKIDKDMFDKIIERLTYLTGMPCEDIMLEYWLTSTGMKGLLITDALVYHCPNSGQPRDWYNVTRKIQGRIAEKGEI